MDQAKYEWLVKVRKMKDELRAKRKSGDKSYLARKMALRHKRMNLKTGAASRKFDVKKQAKINRARGRWNRKSLKWRAKGAKWAGKWARRAARFNVRVA